MIFYIYCDNWETHEDLQIFMYRLHIYIKDFRIFMYRLHIYVKDLDLFLVDCGNCVCFVSFVWVIELDWRD